MALPPCDCLPISTSLLSSYRYNRLLHDEVDPTITIRILSISSREVGQLHAYAMGGERVKLAGEWSEGTRRWC